MNGCFFSCFHYSADISAENTGGFAERYTSALPFVSGASILFIKMTFFRQGFFKMNLLFTVFMYLSGLGAIGGIFIHMMTITGNPLPFPEQYLTIPLTLGVLVAGLAAVIAIRDIAKKKPGEDILRVILGRCQKWMISLVIFFAAYEILFLVAGSRIEFLKAVSSDPNASALLTLSIVWMSVYSAAMAVFFASTRPD